MIFQAGNEMKVKVSSIWKKKKLIETAGFESTTQMIQYPLLR